MELASRPDHPELIRSPQDSAFSTDDAAVLAARLAARQSGMSHMSAVDFHAVLCDLPAEEVHAAYQRWAMTSGWAPQPADLRREVARQRGLPVAPPITEAWAWMASRREGAHPSLDAFARVVGSRPCDYDQFRRLWDVHAREWDATILTVPGLEPAPLHVPPPAEPRTLTITPEILEEAQGSAEFAEALAVISARHLGQAGPR